MPRPGPFTPAAIAAVRREASQTIPDMDPAFTTASEGRCAARAILRHNVHSNNDAVASGASGGLHPRYKELHGKGSARGIELSQITAVVKETFEDLLDAVSA